MKILNTKKYLAHREKNAKVINKQSVVELSISIPGSLEHLKLDIQRRWVLTGWSEEVGVEINIWWCDPRLVSHCDQQVFGTNLNKWIDYSNVLGYVFLPGIHALSYNHTLIWKSTVVIELFLNFLDYTTFSTFFARVMLHYKKWKSQTGQRTLPFDSDC